MLETSISRSADLSNALFISIGIEAAFEGPAVDDTDLVHLEVSNDGGATFANVTEMTPNEFPSTSALRSFDVDVDFAVTDFVVQLRIEPGGLSNGTKFELLMLTIIGSCELAENLCS
jgi:hypothetical protein